ncbi:hypothetical protein [Tsuneonella mangrovi]|uniref:hypothetical protein n=1 Tax=Tsuneonella mangrovi TaxID=1982042 RepID=UPI000BA2AE54|nr:hypothetical protein [Tsuneonella mangrovi]
MRIDPRHIAILLALPALGACVEDYGTVKSTFGEANRQTMMAQVVDPDPQYETLNPPTSGEKAGQAAERYRTDAVKQPEAVRSTSGTGGGGGGGG